LHLGLDGKGPLPATFWIGRICEEFHCIPPVAVQMWRTCPAGWLEEIIEARHYAHAKRVVESAKTKADIPSGELFQLAQEIDLELAWAEMKAKEAALTNG
jgi:hypothetical protein